MPLLKRAKAKNIPVIVLNPNLRRDPRKNVPTYDKKCLLSESMESHALNVWDQYIKPSSV